MVVKRLKSKKSHHNPSPVPMTPKDDSFHGTKKLMNIEWWYFDAMLDNNYSLHVGIRVYNTKGVGIVQSIINIYKNGKIEVQAVKRGLLNNFEASRSLPFVKIGDKKIIDFDSEKYNKTREWSYNVSLQIDDHEVNLTFTGITNGWKIETSDNCWAVPLPKAEVTGTVTMHGKTISVKGIGYHDHNWNYSPITAMNNFGWFWGRVFGDTLSLIWANTMETSKKNNLLAVVNQDTKYSQNEDKFLNVNPESIVFTPKNYVNNHRKRIPTHFNLQMKGFVSNNRIPIDINVTMKAFEIHYNRIFTINYWRYHVKTSGTIAVGSTTEILNDKLQIIEFLSFKS